MRTEDTGEVRREGGCAFGVFPLSEVCVTPPSPADSGRVEGRSSYPFPSSWTALAAVWPQRVSLPPP